MAWLHPPALGCRFSFLHLPSSRCGHSMSAYGEKLLLFGGFDGKRWLNDLHVFDRNSLLWALPTTTGTPPESRQYHSAAVIEGTLYIYGGCNGITWLNDIHALDLAQMHWTTFECTSHSPAPREGHSMVTLGRRLLIYGGWDGSALSDMFIFDSEANDFSPLVHNEPAPARCGHTMTEVNGVFYVFGGYDGLNWSNSLFKVQIEKGVSTWSLPKTIGSPPKRGYHTAVLLNKYILYYAGYNGNYILGDLLTFDTETMTWSIPDPGSGYFPTARNAHSMTLCGSELYVFGGYNGTRDTNEMHVLETAAFSSLHDDFSWAVRNVGGQDLRLKGSQGSYLVHSVIVKHRCPALYSQLLVDFPEFPDRRKGRVTEFELGRCTQGALELFCEFLYSDLSRRSIPDDLREGILFLAIHYNLPRLTNLCFFKAQQGTTGLPESCLIQDMMVARHDAVFSDITVIIDNEKFFLHKIVLAARCEYFSVLFNSGMAEVRNGELRLEDLSVLAFEVIVDWMYSDKFSPLFKGTEISEELGVGLLMAANRLGLPSLMRMTEIVIEKSISLENVLGLYEVAYIVNALHLRSYCVNFVLREFEQLASRGDLWGLSEPALGFISQYLPKKMLRRAHKELLKPSLSLVKLHKDRVKKSKELVMLLTIKSPTASKNPPVPKKKLPKNRAKKLTTMVSPTVKHKDPLGPNFILTGSSTMPSRLKSAHSELFKPKGRLLAAGLRISSYQHS